MIKISPFRALRALPEYVHLIASKPYDVLNSEEARAEAKDNPLSFLYVSKPEINFEGEVDPYSEGVYLKGKEKFEELKSKGFLLKEDSPAFYIYQLEMDGRKQKGLVCGSSIDDYFDDKIKKHEYTLTAKENDRIRHMETKMAQPGMVFLAYKSVDELTKTLDELTKTLDYEYNFTDEFGVIHTLWVVKDKDSIEQIISIVENNIEYSYIADGHHRAAASAKVGLKRRNNNPNHNGTESYNYFLSCLFPHNQLHILDYNRVIKGLNDNSVEEILEKIALNFNITQISNEIIKPCKQKEFSMYVNQKWYKFETKSNLNEITDPVDALDISLFTNYILDPILGITNQRTDKRIDFVGGIRGLEPLKERVDSGERDIAFAFYPVSMLDLMLVADAGKIMPPKSTWFEPKLKSGLLINEI